MRTSKTVPTLALVFSLLMLPLGIVRGQAQQPEDEVIQLFTPQGQELNQPMRVFVTHDVTGGMDPTLMLIDGCDPSKPSGGPGQLFKPRLVARHQQWIETTSGVETSYSGSLLLFDVSRTDMGWWKASIKMTPALTWVEKSGETQETREAIGSGLVMLGNLCRSAIYAIILVFALCVFVVWKSFRKYGRLDRIIRNPDETISISRCQVAAWTVAVVWVVAVYVFMGIPVGEIPETVVILMGMSLSTGGLSYYWAEKARKKPGAGADTPSEGNTNNAESPGGSEPVAEGQKSKQPESKRTSPIPPKELKYLRSWGGLISEFNPETKVTETSLPRAQMLFWTVLIVLIFILRSSLDGVMWNVPWEMVALMGVSQGAYLTPKQQAAREEKPQPGSPQAGDANKPEDQSRSS